MNALQFLSIPGVVSAVEVDHNEAKVYFNLTHSQGKNTTTFSVEASTKARWAQSLMLKDGMHVVVEADWAATYTDPGAPEGYAKAWCTLLAQRVFQVPDSSILTCGGVLTGNVGRNPEMTYFTNNPPQPGMARAQTTFSLAINRRTKGPNGEKIDAATWISVACFGPWMNADDIRNGTAGVANDLLGKGDLVMIQVNDFQAKLFEKDGEDRVGINVVSWNFGLLQSKKETAATPPPAPAAPHRRGVMVSQPANQSAAVADDEDIPF